MATLSPARLKPCLLALLVGKSCKEASNRLIRHNLTSKQHSHCEACYQRVLDFIRADYRHKQNEVVFEAWALGWNIADVEGSLNELNVEEKQVREDWVASCGRERCKEEGVVKGGDVLINHPRTSDCLEDISSHVRDDERRGRVMMV